MLGVCYYPEQWPKSRWREDAEAMASLGLRYVRIAEFAWSRIEPSRGEFEWHWLDEAVDVLAAAGLRVVMCTPTAAPPKWLVDEKPEVLAWDAQGRPRNFGSRRHYCFTSPIWREETRRICEIVAARYGDHAAVAGWQLDNEYGCHETVLSYAPHCRGVFQTWLADRYGDIASLNALWGTVFWSQEYQAFDEVDLPNLTVTEPNPAHQLDYQRFSSEMVVSYNKLQADIIRRRSPGRFVAHNSMGFFTGYDHFAMAPDLDVFAWDSYPLGFTNQRAGLPKALRVRYARTGHPDIAAFHHDLYRGLGRGRWWVMEQQPGPVNWADENPAPAAGMVRLWTWEALAHGAEVVSYFRWRQTPFAQEQMHAGLNRPDYVEDVGFYEARKVAEELKQIDLAAVSRKAAKVALVFDYEAAWVINIQPQGRRFDYQRLVLNFYSALRRLGIEVDIVSRSGPFDGYKLVVVPTSPILPEPTVAALGTSGATVVLGPRSGAKTEGFQIPTELPPGTARAKLPLKVTRVESFPDGFVDGVYWGGRTYTVEIWREYIGTDLPPVATFEDRSGAVFQHDGWHYLGFWPSISFLMDYFEGLLAERQIPSMRLPEDLRLRRRGELRFAFNYGHKPERAPARGSADFLIGEATVQPYGVAVWRES